MSAKNKRVRTEAPNQSIAQNNPKAGLLYQIAFWGLAILLFLSPYFRGLYFAPEQEKALILAAVVFWLVFLWRWLQNDNQFLRHPLDYFALALPVVYLIATITAVNKGLAIDAVIKNLLYFMVYWSAARLVRSPKDINKLLHVFYLSAIGVALAGLATATKVIFIDDGYNVAQYGGFISSTFQYHNALATYLGAVLFIGLYFWYQSFNKPIANIGQDSAVQNLFTKINGLNYLYACGNLLLLIVLFSSKSRAGLLVFALVFAIYLLGVGSKMRFYLLLMAGGLGVAAYVISNKFISLVENVNYGQAWFWLVVGFLATIALQMLFNLVQTYFQKNWQDNNKQYLIAFASLVTMILMAGVVWLVGKPAIIEKITSFSYLWTAYHRVYYVESAIDMIKARPLLGWGGGGWQEAYEAFLNFRYTTREAHSFYFQVGVETGLAGIIIVLGIWISYIVMTYRLFRENLNNLVIRQLLWLLLVVFLMIAGHALIDFDLSLSAITIFLWCVFGMVSGLVTPIEVKSPAEHAALKPVSLVIVSISMVIIASVAGLLAQANSLGLSAYNYFTSNNVDQGIEYYEKASSYNPLNANYHMYLSRAYINKGLPQIALTEAEKAVNQSQYSYAIRNNYIQIALAAGNRNLAAGENEFIYKLAPNNIETYEQYAINYMNLGINELKSGNRDDAKVYLNKVLNVSQLLDRQNKSLSDIDKGLWEGPQLKDTDKIILSKGQAAYCLGKFADAQGYLQQAAQSQNSDINGQALLWQALVQDRKGNQAEANQLLNQISQANPQLMQNYKALKSIPIL